MHVSPHLWRLKISPRSYHKILLKLIMLVLSLNIRFKRFGGGFLNDFLFYFSSKVL